VGVVDQPNIPGTVDEHPNWRRRLPLALDEIASANRCCRAQTRDRGTDAGSGLTHDIFEQV